MTARCEDCGGHVAVDPQGDLNTMVCPHCGSPRPFRDQPSPVRSDGTLRNMVDSDSQVDQGGNPLGEGTIVGSDGEVPLDTGNRGRDNYMHSKVGNLPLPNRVCTKCGGGIASIEGQFPPHFCTSCGKRYTDLPTGREHNEMDPLVHPDPWMDNEPGSLMLPSGPPHIWTGSILAALFEGEGSPYLENMPGFTENDPYHNCPECGHDIPQPYDTMDWSHLKCPNCRLTYNPEEWKGVTQGLEQIPALNHPDPYMDNEPGSLTLPKGSPHTWSSNIAAILAAAPPEVGGVSCPHCGEEMHADPHTGSLYCLNGHEQPVGRDQPQIYDYDSIDWNPMHKGETPGTVDMRDVNWDQVPVRQGKTAAPIGLIGFPCPACKHPTVNEHGHCMNSECGYTMPFDEPEIVTPHHQQGYDMPPAFKSPEEERPGFLQRMFGGAMDDVLGLSPQQPQGNAFMRWEPGTRGRGLIVAGEPHTWTTIDPNSLGATNDPGLTHYQYVKSLGIDPSMVDFNSGVEINPDGTVEVNAGEGRDATPYIHADPRLKEGESRYDTFFNPVSHSANSRTSNTDLYLPWTHEADAVEFDKGPLAGPQHGATIQPGPAGIHGAHYRWLDLLDAHLDGQPARQLGIGGLMMTYADPERKQPVEVRVHHPEHLPAIQEQLEMGQSQPVPAMQELGNRIRNGEVPPPPPREQQQMVASTKESIGLGDIAQIGMLAVPGLGELDAAGMAGEAAMQLGKGAIRGVGSGLMKNALGMGGGGQPQQPQEEAQPNLALAAVLMADYETPTSNPDVGVKTDNDPEKADTKEFNDQDKNPSNFNNPNLQDSGASGEDEVREHEGFAPDSPGINRLEMNLPLVMHYYHSPESGENDPTIRALHEVLEAENPGYLDRVTPEEEQAAEEFVRNYAQKPHGVHAKTAIVNVDPNDINQHMQNTVAPGGNPMMQPGGMQQEGHCPQCGGVLSANGACPQCGAGAMAAGNPQTPMPTPGVMPQGFASVDPLIALAGGIYHGPETAEDEMLRMDEEYWRNLQQKRGLSDEELARERAFHERANREESEYRRNAATHQGPVTPEQISAVQELLIQEGREQETPNVPIHPDQYVKEMAMIQGNPNVAPQVGPQEQTQPPQPQMAPPGAMPVPGMGGGEAGGQPMQPMARSAADNVASKCPRCNSHTTGMLMDEDSHQFCHSCGNIWKADAVEDKSVNKETKVAAPENPIAAPAAERHQQHNPEAEEDSSLTWKDVNGQQLVPGQEYEMINPAYELPDVIRVERVKPDGIEVSIIGTFPNDPNTLQAKTNISREDMKMQHMEFRPVAESQEDRGNEPPPGQQAPGEPPKPQTTDEAATHELSLASSVKDVCPRCGQKEFTSSMASETSYFNECYRCGNTWEEKDPGYETDHNLASRAWINEDSGGDDFFEGMERARAMADAKTQSRDLHAIASKDTRGQQIKEFLDSQPKLGEKMAGRHFTPSEQRELIDEDGVARNADLLQLEGTHYTARADHTGKANAANVPNEHLIMGV